MAQLIIDIPANQVTRVVDALAARWSYDQRKEEGETKVQFIKRVLIERIILEVRRQEAQDAVDIANSNPPPTIT